jgi:glycerophosphoryl diester phosphodiesterase
MITGHTGNDGTTANSVESIEKSILFGADAFEVDVRKDENSVLVLSHDVKAQSVYDTCPRLSDAFKIAAHHGSICINCDLKDDDIANEVIELANYNGIGSDRLILTGSVKPSYLSCHPEIINMADIYMNAENIIEDIYNVTFVDLYIGKLSQTCLNCGVKGINIRYAYLTEDNIKTFTKYGLSISAWTVNNETEMARLLHFGVKNITTCRVEKAKSIRMNLLGF